MVNIFCTSKWYKGEHKEPPGNSIDTIKAQTVNQTYMGGMIPLQIISVASAKMTSYYLSFLLAKKGVIKAQNWVKNKYFNVFWFEKSI